jgi:hypothetical protein
MKLTPNQLRRIIKEEVSQALAEAKDALPREGDIYLDAEDSGRGLKPIDYDIDEVGDLATAGDDIGWYQGDPGPEPGSPGSYVVSFDAGITWTFAPGDLIRAPQFDSKFGGTAWTSKRILQKLTPAAKPAAVSKKDAKVLKVLSDAAFTELTLEDVADFKIRARKGGVAYQYDPPDVKGTEGVITPDMLRGSGITAVEDLAQWMFDHGQEDSTTKTPSINAGLRLRGHA